MPRWHNMLKFSDPQYCTMSVRRAVNPLRIQELISGYRLQSEEHRKDGADSVALVLEKVAGDLEALIAPIASSGKVA